VPAHVGPSYILYCDRGIAYVYARTPRQARAELQTREDLARTGCDLSKIVVRFIENKLTGETGRAIEGIVAIERRTTQETR
jgi:hypothetical protein